MIEIDSINKMLRYVDELPVPTSVIIDDLPDGHEAKTAKIILTETSRELQESGWWFNTEDWWYPQVDGYIIIPTTTISVKSTSKTIKYLVKGGHLYDVAGQTKIFTDGVELTTIFDTSFDDIPSTFANYITYVASKALHTYLNGDTGTQKELEKLIYKQLIKVEKEHMANKDYNLIKGSRLIDRTANPTALS